MAEHFPGFSSSRILFRIILISSLIGICLSWMEVPVHAKSRFLISRNTLDHFKREGLPEKLVQSIEPLMEQVYPDRETFLTALAELEVPPRAPLETDAVSYTHLTLPTTPYV